MNWISYALLSAFAAGLTAVLAKLGVAGVPSNLATAIRTAVVLLFACIILGGSGQWIAIRELQSRAIFFLVLSGIVTGISWLAYFKALQLAPASHVAPIDKLSLPLSILLAATFLGEPISLRLGLGVALMVIGALMTIGS
jgi:transporter family protein